MSVLENAVSDTSPQRVEARRGDKNAWDPTSVPPALLHAARNLRQHIPDAAPCLWPCLRGTQLDGFRLNARGIRVLRLWHHAVWQDLPGVVQRVWEALHLPPPRLPRWGEVTCGSHTAHEDDTHLLTYPPEGKLVVFFIRDKVYCATNGI